MEQAASVGKTTMLLGYPNPPCASLIQFPSCNFSINLFKERFQTFHSCPEIQKVLQSGRTLYVFGETGFGKTEWVRALYPDFLFVDHRQGLSRFNSEIHKGIIYDEFSPDKIDWTIESVLNFLDSNNERSFRCLYRQVHVPRGVSRVVTTNLEPEKLLEAFQRQGASKQQLSALYRRLLPLHVTEKLYNDEGVRATRMMSITLPTQDNQAWIVQNHGDVQEIISKMMAKEKLPESQSRMIDFNNTKLKVRRKPFIPPQLVTDHNIVRKMRSATEVREFGTIRPKLNETNTSVQVGFTETNQIPQPHFPGRLRQHSRLTRRSMRVMSRNRI